MQRVNSPFDVTKIIAAIQRTFAEFALIECYGDIKKRLLDYGKEGAQIEMTGTLSKAASRRMEIVTLLFQLR
ncbi:MAG: hypothetical protein M3M87_07500 [Thermoproteota archaeon]|nr:hypothetical protein [Thermoproteota archaeon]